MTKIERARAIRDAVLAVEDGATRTKVTIDGAEHDAWLIDGGSWHAIVSNLWDLHLAASYANRTMPNDRRNVIGFECIEVVVDETTVLNFVYELDGDEEHLFAYLHGSWEAYFGLNGDGHMPLQRSA